LGMAGVAAAPNRDDIVVAEAEGKILVGSRA
jgi:hypothetical protein